jgi:chemotaxis protein methyltransferase CheR
MEADRQYLAQLLRARAGLALNADQMQRAEMRLAPLARREALASAGELLRLARSRNDPKLEADIIEASAPVETWFFRDKAPFDQLRLAILPALSGARAPGDTLRIWCAGCSTGQEAYSLAIMLEDDPVLCPGVSVEIVATDLSERCIDKAKSGYFTQFEVQRGLPIRALIEHFERDGQTWRASEALRGRVRFVTHNLMTDYRPLGSFDLILCRNVLGLMDPQSRNLALARMADVLSGDGRLLVGAGEPPFPVVGIFAPEGAERGLYRRISKARQVA